VSPDGRPDDRDGARACVRAPWPHSEAQSWSASNSWGVPRQGRGVSDVPGLHFIGLPGSTRNSRQRWSALAGTPPIPPAALAARRLTVRYQRLDRRGRHGGPASDMGGDARGVAVAAVEGPVVQPRPDCHRPPLDAVRRLRPHMQRRGTGAGKQNEHENLPAAGQTRSRGSRHRHEGRSEAHRARPSPQMQLPSGLSPTQASSAYPPPGPQAHDGPMGDGDSSPVACPLPTGLRR